MKKRDYVFKFKGDSKSLIQFNVMNYFIIRQYPQPWKIIEDLVWLIIHYSLVELRTVRLAYLSTFCNVFICTYALKSVRAKSIESKQIVTGRVLSYVYEASCDRRETPGIHCNNGRYDRAIPPGEPVYRLTFLQQR